MLMLQKIQNIEGSFSSMPDPIFVSWGCSQNGFAARTSDTYNWNEDSTISTSFVSNLVPYSI